MNPLRTQLISALGMGCELSWDCPSPEKHIDYTITQVSIIGEDEASVVYNKNKCIIEIPLEQILILPKRDVADVKVSTGGKIKAFLNYYVPLWSLVIMVILTGIIVVESRTPYFYIPAIIISVLWGIKVSRYVQE